MPDHCESHEEHNQSFRDLWKVLNAIKGRVNNHEGRWIIVGVVLTLSLVALFSLQSLNNSYSQRAINEIKVSSKEINEATKQIDKTVASYMAANTQQLNEIKRRLDRVEEEIREVRRKP